MTHPTYFALEGITCSGKTTVMGWMGDLLEKEGYKYNLIPEPVEKYKTWKTYDPLVEMYQNSSQSAAMAQMHMMNEGMRYYSQNIVTAKRTDSDLIISDRSILSPLVMCDTYFRSGKFGAFTKDYLSLMWEEQMSDRYQILDVKPDVHIFLDLPTHLARKRLRADEGQQCKKSETDFLISGDTVEHMQAAYQSFFPKNDIPCRTISVTQKMTSHDVAHAVYTVIREEMCAEGGTEECSHSHEIFDAFQQLAE